VIRIFRAGRWYAHALVRPLFLGYTPETMSSTFIGGLDPDSELEVVMDDVESDDTARDRPGPGVIVIPQ
jgi:hypothetical protein